MDPIPVVILSGFAAVLGANYWWRQHQARRARELLDIVDDGLPYVDVRTGSRMVGGRKRGGRREGGSKVTVVVADLKEPATLTLTDPVTCPAPHRIENPLEHDIIGVWASDELLARARAHEGLLRRFLNGGEIVDGKVAKLLFEGNDDPMGRAAASSDVADVVRALDGLV